MIQRKQSLYILVAVILTVICLCSQIGTFTIVGLGVSRVYNLWYTLPLGGHRLATWPLMALLLVVASSGLYSIFLFRKRKIQALFCMLNVLLIIGWHIWFFVVALTVGEQSWGTVRFRPSWPAVLPVISLILFLLARKAILADEKLVRSVDRIR